MMTSLLGSTSSSKTRRSLPDSGAMFYQEVRAGAWVVDIGIWRNLFDQDVVKTIGELADQGYIRVDCNIKEE